MSYKLLLCLPLLSIATTLTMETPKQTEPRHIPPLYQICMNQMSAGFGNNAIEKHANAIQNLATLYTIHKEGRYKHIPYGIGYDEVEIVKNNITPNHLCFNSGKSKFYKNITTQFLVKQSNDTFFIQDNMTDIAAFNIQSGEIKKIGQENSFIRSCITTKKTNILINGNHDGIITIWPIGSNDCFCSNIHGNAAIICLTEEDNILCSSDQNSFIAVSSLNNDRLCRHKPITLPDLFSDITYSSIMLHNKLLYAGSSKGCVNLHDIRSEDVHNSFQAHKHRVSCLIACKHNDQHFYSGSFDGSIKQWDLRNITECLHSFEHQKYGITCMYQSNDGQKIYSGGADGIRIWDISADKNVQQPKEIHAVYGCKNNKITIKANLNYVDCIAVNDDESEIYIANIPSGITVLHQSDIYSIEKLMEKIT